MSPKTTLMPRQTHAPLNGVLSLLPDESLNGYIARLARNYVFDAPQHLLSSLEIDAIGLSKLHASPLIIRQLADRLSIASDELDKRRYSATRRPSNIRFAGHEIRGVVFAGYTPRIPPHTFRRLGYHRICWDLGFVDADPNSGERLISGCPECKAPFRWDQPNFLNCRSCGESLTKAPASYVDADHRAAIAIFSGLLSLDSVTVRAMRATLAPEVRRVSPLLLLGVLYELSRRPLSERKGRGKIPVRIDWARGLLHTLQILTGWPAAALSLIDELTAGGRKRQDKAGLGYSFGALRRILPDWGPIPELHSVALPVLRAMGSGDFSPFQPPKFGTVEALIQASETSLPPQALYGWCSRKIEALRPFLHTHSILKFGSRFDYDSGAIERAVAQIADLASIEMIKAKYGLEANVTSELHRAGYFIPADADFSDIADSNLPLYSTRQIESFFAGLIDRYEAAPRGTRRIGFTMIVSRIGELPGSAHERLIRAIFDGSLRPIHIKKKARCVFERLQFNFDKASAWVSKQLGVDVTCVSILEVARILGVELPVVYRLARASLLDLTPDLLNPQQPAVTIASWAAFQQKYVSLSELVKIHQSTFALVSQSLREIRIPEISIDGFRVPIIEWANLPGSFRIAPRRDG